MWAGRMLVPDTVQFGYLEGQNPADVGLVG